MPRGNRGLYPGALFHVMNRGVARRDLFLSAEDYLRFMALLPKLEERFGVFTTAYCLMPNHFHLLMKDEDCRLSEALRFLSWHYAYEFNRRQGRDGPLFRGRFKSVRIESADQLRRTLDYIHDNPVKACLSSSAQAWPWSSSRLSFETLTSPLQADLQS